ncbi:MAG: hypothetical protein ABJC74_07530 [Gemmatimonadota bacterium]
MTTLLQVTVGGGGQTPEVIQIGHSPMPPEAIFLFALAVLVVSAIVLWPLVRAWSRRIEGRGQPDQAVLDELDQMRQRLSQVEDLPHRVAELEERAEFAERLLAQREPDRLPGRIGS